MRETIGRHFDVVVVIWFLTLAVGWSFVMLSKSDLRTDQNVPAKMPDTQDHLGKPLPPAADGPRHESEAELRYHGSASEVLQKYTDKIKKNR